MALYILDATAVISLGDACAHGHHDVRGVEDAMTALAIAGQLLSPASVLKRCNTVGANEIGTRWLRSNSGHFGTVDEPWDYVETVLSSCEELLDPDDMTENVQVGVLAVALRLAETHADVEVVTDQWVDTPLQMSQATAATRLGVVAISVDQFVNQILTL